jgi:anaerobic selenocysteine-containing dehydrogenase
MAIERIPGFCALCRSRCGCVSIVEDSRLVGVEADPAHPTGRNLCVKGRAAPELVYAPDRLLHPMKRTRPRGDAPDVIWAQFGWPEASYNDLIDPDAADPISGTVALRSHLCEVLKDGG